MNKETLLKIAAEVDEVAVMVKGREGASTAPQYLKSLSDFIMKAASELPEENKASKYALEAAIKTGMQFNTVDGFIDLVRKIQENVDFSS